MIKEFSPTTDGWIDGGAARTILVGPPGCGKTYALMRSFLLPAVEAGKSVLACSFTKAAAVEMSERLQKQSRVAMSENELRDTCRTIHSEAYRLLRTESRIMLWKGKKAKSILGDEDLPENYADAVADPSDEALGLWSEARNKYWPDDRAVPLEDLLTRAWCERVVKPGTCLEQLIAEVRHYEGVKKEAGGGDFVDLLDAALIVPAPRRDLLIVDEAQDLFPLQIALVEKWSQKAKQTILIGDPDQGIYEFLGANGKYLTKQILDGVQSFRLSQSYRVPRTVHALARCIITSNRDRVDAPYEPMDVEGSVGTLQREDAVGVVSACVGGDNDAFILTRAGSKLAPYAEMLATSGIPYKSNRIRSPWQSRTAAAVVLAITSLRETRMVRVGDAVLLAESLMNTREKINRAHRWFAGTKKDCVAKLTEWSHEDPEQLLDSGAIRMAGLDLGPLLSKGLTVMGAINLASKNLCADVNVEALLAIVERFGVSAIRDEPKITLTTYHGAKGREADIVVVDGEMPWPTQQEIAANGREVERRCLYVAVTRAKRDLIYVRGDKRDIAYALEVEI